LYNLAFKVMSGIGQGIVKETVVSDPENPISGSDRRENQEVALTSTSGIIRSHQVNVSHCSID
jgi:hypothetical protein